MNENITPSGVEVDPSLLIGGVPSQSPGEKEASKQPSFTPVKPQRTSFQLGPSGWGTTDSSKDQSPVWEPTDRFTLSNSREQPAQEEKTTPVSPELRRQAMEQVFLHWNSATLVDQKKKEYEQAKASFSSGSLEYQKFSDLIQLCDQASKYYRDCISSLQKSAPAAYPDVHQKQSKLATDLFAWDQLESQPSQNEPLKLIEQVECDYDSLKIYEEKLSNVESCIKHWTQHEDEAFDRLNTAHSNFKKAIDFQKKVIEGRKNLMSYIHSPFEARDEAMLTTERTAKFELLENTTQSSYCFDRGRICAARRTEKIDLWDCRRYGDFPRDEFEFEKLNLDKINQGLKIEALRQQLVIADTAFDQDRVTLRSLLGIPSEAITAGIKIFPVDFEVKGASYYLKAIDTFNAAFKNLRKEKEKNRIKGSYLHELGKVFLSIAEVIRMRPIYEARTGYDDPEFLKSQRSLLSIAEDLQNAITELEKGNDIIASYLAKRGMVYSTALHLESGTPWYLIPRSKERDAVMFLYSDAMIQLRLNNKQQADFLAKEADALLDVIRESSKKNPNQTVIASKRQLAESYRSKFEQLDASSNASNCTIM